MEGTWTSLNPAVGNLSAVVSNVLNQNCETLKKLKIKNTCNQTGLARLIAAYIFAVQEFMKMNENVK